MNGELRQAVLDYLLREADLDGLVIVPEREIAEAVGISQVHAGRCVHSLAADGLLTVGLREGGWGRASGPINAIQLADSVLS